MNPPPDNAPTQGTADAGPGQTGPENWREAFMALISARIALIQFEAGEAARQRARRVVGVIVAALCLFFTWALLLAGGIAALSSATGWPWHWLALGVATLHMLVAILLLKTGSASQAAPAFPLTRAEFQKDREWIENFQKKPKSND
jgi:MFS family permease